MDASPPPDKLNIIYLILIFHGIGTLMAWNMFITAKDYFVKYKLVDTQYALNFLAYVGWAAQIPNVLFNWFNVFANIGGKITHRVVGSIIIMLVLFVITVVLAMIDTSNDPAMFFWLTMITIFILNGSNAIFQNCIIGIAARLPPKFMGAYVLGTNMCGITVVFISWLSTFLRDLRTSAIFYFSCGIIVLVICFITYITLPLNKFYRYCTRDVNKGAPAPGNSPAQPTKVPYGLIFRQSWAQLYNVYITFCVTLSMFPAVTSDIMPVTEGFLGDNFMLITCFLTFSISAMMGNITANIWQIPSKKFLIVFTTTRLVFIPLLLLCNYQVPDRTLTVIIKSDWVYWIIDALFGWSSGHASSLAMMYVGGEVAPEHAAKAGMIAGAILMSGIFSGVIVTRLAPIIVSL